MQTVLKVCVFLAVTAVDSATGGSIFCLDDDGKSDTAAPLNTQLLRRQQRQLQNRFTGRVTERFPSGPRLIVVSDLMADSPIDTREAVDAVEPAAIGPVASETPEECYLPKYSGPCYAFVPSFAFNYRTHECEAFTYGGCNGNANRFATEAECLRRCSPDY